MFASFKLRSIKPSYFTSNTDSRIIRKGPLESATIETFEKSQKTANKKNSTKQEKSKKTGKKKRKSMKQEKESSPKKLKTSTESKKSSKSKTSNKKDKKKAPNKKVKKKHQHLKREFFLTVFKNVFKLCENSASSNMSFSRV